MKLIILFTLSMIIAFSSKAQIVQYYGGCGNETAMDMAKSNNSIYIVGATKSYSWGNGELYVLKSDLNGNNIWAKKYSSVNSYAQQKICVLNNNNILILNNLQSSVINIDSNGVVRWAKQFDQQINTSTISKFNNDIVITGFIADPDDDRNTILIKMDSAGNVIKSDYLSFSPDDTGAGETFVPADVLIENDSTIVLAGNYNGTVNCTFVSKLDNQFNVKKLLVFHYNYLLLKVKSVVSNNNFGYLIAGEDLMNAFFCNIDSGLNITWYKKYSDGFNNSQKFINANNDYFLVSNYGVAYSDDFDNYILKINSSGTITMSKTVGDDVYHYSFVDILQVDDNKYFLLNTSNSNIAANLIAGQQQNDILLFSIDSTGATSPAIPNNLVISTDSVDNVSIVNYTFTRHDTLLSLSNISITANDVNSTFNSTDCVGVGIDSYDKTMNSISIFPNPNFGTVNIQVKNATEEEIQVEIYNSHGQLIIDDQYDKVSDDQVIQINNQFATGIYLVKIKIGQTVLTEKLNCLR